MSPPVTTPGRRRPGLRLGINYPWRSYGWDFGDPPRSDKGNPWGEAAAWRHFVDSDLAAFRRLGLFAVRWFLLGDGLLYGTGKGQPRRDPQSGQWRFPACPPVSESFVAHLRLLLERCRAAKMLLLPSLVDFHIGLPGQPVAGASAYVKCGRRDLFIDEARRDQLFDEVLGALLELAAQFRDVVYAIELVNEPEWLTRPQGDRPAAVDEEEMKEFIREGIGRINDAGFLSTVGFADPATLGRWDSPRLGITLHQIHYYPGDPLPRHVYDPRWPVIVGEFATARHRPWPELGTRQDLRSRLAHLEAKGYPVAFLWAADTWNRESEEPHAVDWGEANQQAVARFLRGG